MSSLRSYGTPKTRSMSLTLFSSHYGEAGSWRDSPADGCNSPEACGRNSFETHSTASFATSKAAERAPRPEVVWPAGAFLDGFVDPFQKIHSVIGVSETRISLPPVPKLFSFPLDPASGLAVDCEFQGLPASRPRFSGPSSRGSDTITTTCLLANRVSDGFRRDQAVKPLAWSGRPVGSRSGLRIPNAAPATRVVLFMTASRLRPVTSRVLPSRRGILESLRIQSGAWGVVNRSVVSSRGAALQSPRPSHGSWASLFISFRARIVHGFRHFSFRGLKKSNAEWHLIGLAVNPRRMSGGMRATAV